MIVMTIGATNGEGRQNVSRGSGDDRWFCVRRVPKKPLDWQGPITQTTIKYHFDTVIK
jgi:hypothetical protein